MTEWDGRGLVSATWLEDHLADPALRLFDATVHLRPSAVGPYRVESGRADYLTSHIPGAAFADLTGELSDANAALAFTLPKPADLARAMGKIGVGPGTRVVIYSTTTPMWATRLWWMFRSAGFDDAAVLDGGLASWRTDGRPLETGERSYPAAHFPLAFRPDCWTDKAGVLGAIGDSGVCTLNALSPSVHRGEGGTNYGRRGHIAGSRNLPYASLLEADGRWKRDDELRALFESVDALSRPRVICYCGGGISATMDALALTRLGHPAVAVYDGSMSEWSGDPTLPMQTGD